MTNGHDGGGGAAQLPVTMRVQRALYRLGYYRGMIDGVIGSKTREAIATFQEHHGLIITGEIDDELVSALRDRWGSLS
jgi:peptidoglycan hydrolase-like protein with peptidoglycan-binding domain